MTSAPPRRATGTARALAPTPLPAPLSPLAMPDTAATATVRTAPQRRTPPVGSATVRLVLGSGPRGVVLFHENGWNICGRPAFAEELTAAGQQVLVHDRRNVHEGASGEGGRAADVHSGREVRAVVHQLRPLGVRRMLAGGASMGGTATAPVAPEIPNPSACSPCPRPANSPWRGPFQVLWR